MKQPGRLFNGINAVVAVLFLISAVLQYNDPDPWLWAALYAAAGVACLAAPRMRSRMWLPAAVGLAALIWAGLLAPETLPNFRVRDLAATMHAETPSIELNRELLGLLIIAAWMVVLVVVGRRGHAAR